MYLVRVDSLVPIASLFAARDILTGEELSFDYGGDAMVQIGARDEEDKVADQSPNPELFAKDRKICLCGSEKCRKYLPFDTSL